MDFWDFFWLLVWSFFFVAYLIVLFQVLGDLFRDDDLSGWFKALWVIALILVPFLALLVYLVSRGRGMAERQAHSIRDMQARTDAHIRDVAGGSTATEQITAAKGLLDSGAITAEEFEQIKRTALA
jgi:ABC-type multidrug transport system fused ATPase/permease subunit